MKIAVDIDGVLLDFIVSFCEIFNKRHHTNFQKKDVTNWEFFQDWKILEEEAYEIFYYIYDNKISVPLIDEEAPSFMKNLNKKHEVYVVSARTHQYRDQTLEKLRSHKVRQGIEFIDLVLVDHKPYDLKLNLNYNLYVDDNPNLVEPIKLLPDKSLLLYDQPWNQKSVCDKNVVRVKNWKEVYDKLNL
jgi:uncharacterized HAD superfamily protein